ncbi:MAG: hypothetical protein KC464_33005, partial [Myxococcales bacterium]|nr:hypothetical protein [Myxococcales bacterium]
DLPGDAALAGSLDLSRMELVGDHYEVPLDGGRRAVLTLDPTLQQAAEKVLARAKAPRGAVVITATDGRILAYAGRRTEDPKGGKDGIVDLGLVNTAWAPAASVFKLVSASAMIDAGVDPHGKVCYHGGLRSVMASNLEDDKHDNKCADLSYGLAHSQNAIIAKLAHQHLEPARLRETAEALSFGGDLPAWSMGGEAGRSEIPDAKGVEFGKTAAGFTGTYLSPVGGALLANTFATGGEMVTPRLVDAIVDDGGRHDLTAAPSTRVLPAKVARTVAAMMVETCDSGSAAKAFRGKDGLPRSVKVAGKTGTLSRDEPLPLQYSWFVGFAPADDPAISVAVVLGNTDLWWLKAHTAARMLVAEALKPARTAKSGKSGHQ